MKNNKVLVTATTFPRHEKDNQPGFVRDLSLELLKLGLDVHVLVPHSHKLSYFKNDNGLKIFRFKYFIPKYEKLAYGGIVPNIKKNKLLILQAPFLFLFQLISLIKLIRKFKINILHSHWIIPQGISGAIVKRIFKIKHVLTIHGADLFVLLKMPFGKEIIKFVIKNSDEVTCVNHEIKEKIKKIIDKKNINVIPMGVNVKDYLTKPKFNNKILFLGRLAEKKGVKYVLEAAKYLSKFKFYIAGDGPLRNELELFVKRNKIKNVRFLGYIHGKNKIKLIKESGIFIIPSIHTKGGDREGLPVSLLEAMAASKAIITTDVGGIKDLIKNDYNGIIIKEKNYNEIVNAVSRLKKDFAKKLGSNARKTVLDYDWKIIGMKHYNILKR